MGKYFCIHFFTKNTLITYYRRTLDTHKLRSRYWYSDRKKDLKKNLSTNGTLEGGCDREGEERSKEGYRHEVKEEDTIPVVCNWRYGHGGSGKSRLWSRQELVRVSKLWSKWVRLGGPKTSLANWSSSRALEPIKILLSFWYSWLFFARLMKKWPKLRISRQLIRNNQT